MSQVEDWRLLCSVVEPVHFNPAPVPAPALQYTIFCCKIVLCVSNFTFYFTGACFIHIKVRGVLSVSLLLR